MKKTLFIISVLIITALSSLAQQNIPCCPDFTIDNLTGIGKECCMSCDNSLADTSNTGGGVGQGLLHYLRSIAALVGGAAQAGRAEYGRAHRSAGDRRLLSQGRDRRQCAGRDQGGRRPCRGERDAGHRHVRSKAH